MTLRFDPIPVPLHMDESGSVRVSGTRVTLDTIIRSVKAGESPEELAEDFPRVPLADIYAVLSYYARHRAEVDAYLHKREEEAAQLRQVLEARYDKEALRERMRAHRAARETESYAPADRG